MRILAIDHGSNYLGWAFRNGDSKPVYGIRDYTEIKYPQVLTTIHQEVSRFMDKSNPDFLITEKPMQQRGGYTTQVLIGTYSAVILAAVERNIQIFEMRPDELKSLAGKKGADKWDVAVAVQQYYGIDFDEIAIPLLYKRDDPKGKFKKGDVRDRLYDPADALALIWAFQSKIQNRKVG